MIKWLCFVAGVLQMCIYTDASGVLPVRRPEPTYQALPSLREQAVIQDAWTAERKTLVPEMLQKYGVDAWLMSQKEYAEDTVFWSLKSAKSFSARRRTIHLFLANPVEGSTFYSWIDNTPTIWSNVLDVLTSQNVSSIAVNIDGDLAFSSGLHAGEYANIVRYLGPEWSKKLVNKPMLAVEYIATMTKSKLGWYRKLQETAWAMISEAFSETVIVPGKTSAEDVEWWLRDKIQKHNYTTWFMPTVDIVRPDTRWPNTTDESLIMAQTDIIEYGDLLHVDFGVTAMGLNTDTQHLAYVLPPGETSVPQGLRDGLKKANRLQDIVKSNMKIGLSGNDILKTSIEQMESEGIEGKIYCHAIGDWGHSAGTVIGMTNLQDTVPVLGDIPLLNKTYYSVELYAEHYVPEVEGTVIFALEEDVYWMEGDKWEWVWDRQEEFHLIKPHGDVLRVQDL